VFYSITSTQAGLRGISFGNFLIKQVASDLRAELPKLKIFATLSPIPGLRAWARTRSFAGDTALQAAIASNDPPTPDGRERFESLAAWYLTREWEAGHILDPVARFHLGNGARLERINWAADTSPKGAKQSFGLMVNYVYDLDDVESNHEEYVNRHLAVHSAAVEKLARAAEPLMAVQRAAPIATA
jgi:malonyl-CoA decarboxylase